MIRKKGYAAQRELKLSAAYAVADGHDCRHGPSQKHADDSGKRILRPLPVAVGRDDAEDGLKPHVVLGTFLCATLKRTTPYCYGVAVRRSGIRRQ